MADDNYTLAFTGAQPDALLGNENTTVSSQNAYFAWAPISSKSISATGVIGFYRVVGWNV